MPLPSVETQDRLLDLFSATASEAAIDAVPSGPGLLENPKRCGVVRGCAGEQWAFSGHGREEALERGTGDSSAPERPIDPIGHLGLVVDDEGADRPGDRSVGLDHALHTARVIPDPRHVDEEGLTIRRILGGEGGHPDRLWIFHLLMDRIEVGVHERPKRNLHPAMVAPEVSAKAMSSKKAGNNVAKFRVTSRMGWRPIGAALLVLGACASRVSADECIAHWNDNGPRDVVAAEKYSVSDVTAGQNKAGQWGCGLLFHSGEEEPWRIYVIIVEAGSVAGNWDSMAGSSWGIDSPEGPIQVMTGVNSDGTLDSA